MQMNWCFYFQALVTISVGRIAFTWHAEMRGTQFTELNAFVAVAEHGNFTKAAAQLAIAPPTLSETIRSLGERLGVRLFNRTARSVALTEAGEQLLAELCSQRWQRARSRRRSRERLPGRSGRQAAPAGAPSGGDGDNRSFHAAILTRIPPEFRFEIVADDADHDIINGHFDARVRLGKRIEKDMISDPPARRVLDGWRSPAPGLSATDIRRPRCRTTFRAHNCIRQREDWDGTVHHRGIEKAGERIKVVVDGHFIINDTQLVLSAAIKGIGIAYLSEPIVRPHIVDGAIDSACWRTGACAGARRPLLYPIQVNAQFQRQSQLSLILCVNNQG